MDRYRKRRRKRVDRWRVRGRQIKRKEGVFGGGGGGRERYGDSSNRE